MDGATRLSEAELSAWTRLAAVIELTPRVLDNQLRRDASLTHFDYTVLTALSEAPDQTMGMTPLSVFTSATLPRLSHVVSRLSERGLVARSNHPEDARITTVTLTGEGHEVLHRVALRHWATVRRRLFRSLSQQQLDQLATIMDTVLEGLDPTGQANDACSRYDSTHRR